jgi:hypothetical protein
MMQRYMRITSAQTSEQRGHEAGESYQRVASKRAEQEIEPNYVGFQTMQRLEQAGPAAKIIERPAAHDIKPFRLNMVGRELVGQHRKVEKRITLQLLRDVKPIFTQSSGTWGKSGNQTDFHLSPVLLALRVRCAFRRRCWQASGRKK